MNSVQLIGYLGNDPTLKTATNGSQLTWLRLATDYMRKDEEGKTMKKTSWHNIIAWEKLATLAIETLSKGSHLLIEGELVYRTYTAKDGTTKNITEIRASKLIDLDR